MAHAGRMKTFARGGISIIHWRVGKPQVKCGACPNQAFIPVSDEVIVRETWPGPEVESDDDILNAFGMLGTCGYHAVGTCRMGKDPHSIVDPVLRVKGVENLRVINFSIAPFVIAGIPTRPFLRSLSGRLICLARRLIKPDAPLRSAS